MDRSSFQAQDGDLYGESEYQTFIDKMADSDIEAKFEQMLVSKKSYFLFYVEDGFIPRL